MMVPQALPRIGLLAGAQHVFSYGNGGIRLCHDELRDRAGVEQVAHNLISRPGSWSLSRSSSPSASGEVRKNSTKLVSGRRMR